jgi:ribosome-binding factor A
LNAPALVLRLRRYFYSPRETMKRRQPSKRDLAAFCAEVESDDGTDPKQFFRRHTTRKKANRKAMQLCSQVAGVLSQVLSGECGDEVLNQLQVVSVVAVADGSELLVNVAPLFADGPEAGLVLSRLAAACSMLRAEVAAAITRRRVPKLRFQFVAGPIQEAKERT